MGDMIETLQTVCSPCVEKTVRVSQEEARQADAERRKRRMARMGLEGQLLGMTFDRYAPDHQPLAYDAAQAFVLSFPNQLAIGFSGGVGAGKTHLAVAILHAISEWGEDGHYVYLPGLLADLSMASDWQDAANKAFVPLYRSSVLVLDDCGRERYRPDSNFPAMRDTLIHRRIINGYPTIATTNLSPRDFNHWLGEAAASRFLSAGDVITMADGDRRFSRPITSPIPVSERNPTKACLTCGNAGWVYDGKLRAGNPDRLMRCPACEGRGY